MNRRRLRVFLDLLPFRVKQAVAGQAFDRFWIRRQRLRSQQKAVYGHEQTRRLFVDLAVISKDDAGTGIQRVVRALALALAHDRSSGWDVQFVAANRRSRYHSIAWPFHESEVDCCEIEARPGDVFIGLDFSLDAVRRHGRQLMQFRRDGGILWFLVHDLLPLEHPEWFSRNTVIRYKAWLDVIAGIADGFFCNSEQTEQKLKYVLNARYGLSQGYKAKVLPMGYNILQTIAEPSVVPDVSIRFDSAHPFFLMVGTLEPRKGHELVIAAFEEIWATEAVQKLVLVGRMGWHVEDLRDYIVGHSEFGKRLLWFDDVEDVELEQIYQACEGVIVASYAEGFGLPLIEALGHQKPVLARDIPVFRIHEKSGVYFFPQDANSHDLRLCIESWAGEIEAGLVEISLPEACWSDSAQHLLSCLA